MKTIINTFKIWLPLAVAITLVLIAAYIFVQQNYRLSANDPQIQMAEDTAAKINSGTTATDLVSKDNVDIKNSLSPFVIIFDKNKKVLAGNALLDGTTPTPPEGTFNSTVKNGENRFSWQPEDDVRLAAVVVPIDGGNKGYVLAGRSLREVEKREEELTKIAGMAWFGTLFITFFVILCLEVLNLLPFELKIVAKK